MCSIMDNLPTLEEKLSAETISALLYIAGYVIRRDEQHEDTYSFCEKYGTYLDELNRGGLTKPGDSVVQWVIYSHIVFNAVFEHVCRKSLSNVLMIISELYGLNMERHHALTLSNIFFNNDCNFSNPRSEKEPR